MANSNTEFWLSLLFFDDYANHRAWFWNGYLGWKLPLRVKDESVNKEVWPKLIVAPPEGGWPELTKKEKAKIDKLAEHYGGHPEFDQNYMDFSEHIFRGGIDLSGLTFVYSNFDGAIFDTGTSSFNKTRFFGQTCFNRAIFDNIHFHGAKFDAPVYFGSTQFKHIATFIDVEFMGGASFKNALFESYVRFDGSKFEERYFSGSTTVPVLTDFSNAKFMGGAIFRDVFFGNNEKTYSRKIWPERRVDFSDAEFKTTTDFRRAVFGGAPAFFNATLHEDTDFSHIDWKKAETDNISADYAIRAWERLELMMSKLEKPLERYQFFRLKMRTRRRIDNWFLRFLNRIFEVTADYGWSVWRAFLFWLGHWLVFSFVLYLNAGTEAIKADSWGLAKAALGTGFANAHAFLGLATGDGYLAPCRQLLLKNNSLGLLTEIGTIEAFLGPIFLFLLLLTLRNRFRLA